MCHIVPNRHCNSVIIGFSLMHRKIYNGFYVVVVIMYIRVIMIAHVLNTVLCPIAGILWISLISQIFRVMYRNNSFIFIIFRHMLVTAFTTIITATQTVILEKCDLVPEDMIHAMATQAVHIHFFSTNHMS